MVSIVICSNDAGRFARANQMFARLLPPVLFEIIHIADATGLAEGYNRGLRQSRGAIVIFSHDDIEFVANDFGNRIIRHMDSCDVLGVMGTRRLSGPNWCEGSGLPYGYGQMAYRNTQTGKFDVVIWSVPARRVDNMQAMDGMFLCARREVAEKLRFDQEVFRRFHLYDIDFTYRAHKAGYRCSVAADLHAIHASGGRFDQQWEQDCRRFVELHGHQLAPPVNRPFRAGSIAVDTMQDLVEVMTPPHWGDEAPRKEIQTGFWRRMKRSLLNA
jgi:hypothetical protein